MREGRELHVAAAATRLTSAGGDYEGTVLVLDDVTPLIRARSRRVARICAAPRSRDQESIDADSVVGGAHAAQAVGPRPNAERPRARVHVDDHR